MVQNPRQECDSFVNENLTAKRTIPGNSSSDQAHRPVGLFRRLGAGLYDGFLVAAILLFAHIPLQLLFETSVVPPEHPWHWVYQLYLMGICFLYFSWCWMRGQTLGMRAWRIHLQGEHGQRVTWKRVSIRFLSAILSWSIFGLGFFWVLIDHERKSWHDRLSGTVLVFVPR
uniref:Uncharacterized membrane protein YckC, RDD family n=1 Tax=Candidatus Kentrum sp. SD TaxID=2126332 RepID=A0A450YLU2_9GAMM|nr:MAG: Uncharacterized membrane protein YckC, RDD family [Candidatus Kentron sp. SD]VFK42466.1 MAG: Uncharacterized membrane protein YckC, RDD family [Candidatus Kentron sp. SD]VFK78143.1 MAG: Uncharacterized membrane protein YckC, RDD family [Candidatus Kentron sp. SD]